MEWQPIETAPKDGTEILIILYRSNGDCWGQVVALWADTDGDGYSCEAHWSGIAGKNRFYPVGYKPTHWMPLPDPPDKPLAKIFVKKMTPR